MSDRTHLVDLLAVSLHAVERGVATGGLLRSARYWPRVARDDTVGELFDAAHGNAALAHRLDWDDVMVGVPTHPGTVVGAVALAAAGPAAATIDEVAAALKAGVSECARVGDALGEEHYERGWHATATIGRIAAAVTSAAMLHPGNAEAQQRARQLAAAQAGGVTDAFGGSGKWVQVAAAAGSAAVCGLLAGTPMEVIEVLRPDTRLGRLLGQRAPLGDRPRDAMGRLRVKRHPCCYHAHPAVLAAERLVSGERPVQVAISSQASQVCHARQPANVDEARFSVPWLVAGALLPAADGALGLMDGSITVDGPQAVLAATVRMVVDERLPPFAARVWQGNEYVEVDLGVDTAGARADVARKVGLLDSPVRRGRLMALLDNFDGCSPLGAFLDGLHP